MAESTHHGFRVNDIYFDVSVALARHKMVYASWRPSSAPVPRLANMAHAEDRTVFPVRSDEERGLLCCVGRVNIRRTRGTATLATPKRPGKVAIATWCSTGSANIYHIVAPSTWSRAWLVKGWLGWSYIEAGLTVRLGAHAMIFQPNAVPRPPRESSDRFPLDRPQPPMSKGFGVASGHKSGAVQLELTMQALTFKGMPRWP